jgi:RNA polymerase sigma-70 factor (ECF subfamily)
MSSDTIAPRATLAPDAELRSAFERFSRRLIGLARVHLGGRLRHKVDPEDIVQSAYRSFLGRYPERAASTLGWEGLWGLLTLITVRKCADRARYFAADCRDLEREAGAWSSGERASSWQHAVGREPTPDEALALAEAVADLLAGLSGDERDIVELSLQGYSTQEISERLGRAERSVRRIREHVRKHLEQRQT